MSAAGQTNTMDTLLVTLASMGFDLDRGQAAIEAGKLTVHEAVEWLLQDGDKTQEIASRAAPTLSLRPTSQRPGASEVSDQQYLPFSMPPVSIATDPSPPATAAVSSSHQPPSGSSEVDEKVVSRYKLTDKKRDDKDRWEREQREELSAKYKEERMRKKQAHTKVLKEIEDDRRAKLLKTSPKASPTSPTSPMAPPQQQPGPGAQDPAGPSAVQGSQQTASKSTTAEQSKEMSREAERQSDVPKPVVSVMCTLQIRLPSGQHMREKLTSESSLHDVIVKIGEQHPQLGDHVELLQPFPRKVFSSEELSKTLEELGLTPSGTLVVRAASPAQAQAQAPSIPEDLNTGQPTPGRHPGFRAGGRIEPMPPLPPHHPHAHGQAHPQDQASHRWGQGHVVGDSSGGVAGGAASDAVPEEREEEGGVVEEAEMDAGGAQPEEGEGMAVDEAGLGRDLADEEMEVMGEEEGEGEDERMDMWDRDVPPELQQHMAGILGGGGGGRGGMGRRGFGQHDWGEGRRLNDNGPRRFDYGFRQAQGPEDEGEGEEQEQGGPSAARMAAAVMQRLVNVASPSSSPSPAPLDRPIPSLLDLCVKCTSKRLESPQGGAGRLEAVPPSLAERLLTELKKSGHLRPKTLLMFIPCHLQRLSLDCYKYTTNELLQTVRPHVNLCSLNLASCPLITDQGLQPLTSLKKLQHLNLGGNKNLTDKIFAIVQEFPQLTTLLLEETSVSDAGIETLAANPPPNLANLSLNRTHVTDAAVLYLARMSVLKNLGLEQTQVQTLEHIGHLSQLVSLNLSRNTLTKEGLLRLHQVPSLRALNISHIEGLTGDEALLCLQGLPLMQLTLPDRHTTTDSGLKSIAGMSLCSLDLTDYIHVTDAGIHHVADMTSLQKLSITNTKVTSTGMAYLNGLTELRELHLDRTVVDDAGSEVIKEMNKLQVISMAATNITDKFLLSGALNRCGYLSRLNLSRTDITDQGIARLVLPYLTLLNLDYTCVSLDCAQSLTQCPSLKLIRTNNLRNPRLLDQV